MSWEIGRRLQHSRLDKYCNKSGIVAKLSAHDRARFGYLHRRAYSKHLKKQRRHGNLHQPEVSLYHRRCFVKGIIAEIRTNIEADDYLHKPVENKRLKEAVANLLMKQPERDWKSIAKGKLEAVKAVKKVRAAERSLNRRKAKKK